MKKRVLLGMSGGIDSSMAAYLLLREGYEVIGVTLQMYNQNEDPAHSADGKHASDTINEAKRVAGTLGIEHHDIDIREEFNATVISHFIQEYLKGRTPNPCVFCNKTIKWPYLDKLAKKYECELIATGHYARIVEKGNKFYLQQGKDQKKDQSYFMWSLTQDLLSKIIFPLGEYTKTEIKELAAKKGFKDLSQKKESQEICFIHDNDYRRFLKDAIPNEIKHIGKGNFISMDNKILGQHQGFPFYTIGQRKGLNIALGKPAYVTEIDPVHNKIRIGERKHSYKQSMLVKDWQLTDNIKEHETREIDVKVRYKSPAVKGTISKYNTYLFIRFSEPLFAITPGQSAVFYGGDLVIGGGVITQEAETGI